MRYALSRSPCRWGNSHLTPSLCQCARTPPVITRWVASGRGVCGLRKWGSGGWEARQVWVKGYSAPFKLPGCSEETILPCLLLQFLCSNFSALISQWTKGYSSSLWTSQSGLPTGCVCNSPSLPRHQLLDLPPHRDERWPRLSFGGKAQKDTQIFLHVAKAGGDGDQKSWLMNNGFTGILSGLLGVIAQRRGASCPSSLLVPHVRH